VTAQAIARLEGLLARVRVRAAEPRVRRVPSAATAALSVPAVAAAPVAAPVPPPEPEFEPPTPPPIREREVTIEVDLLEPGIEVMPTVQEPAPAPSAEAFESRERMIAAHPVGDVAAESASRESAPELRVETSAAAAPPEAEMLPASAVEDVTEEEEAPVSSRRPLAPQPEERLEQMAFGNEEPQPPRHTPPPESGRLPAAPVPDFDGDDVTGVRDAQPAADPRAAAPARALEPEVTRPAIASGAPVVDWVGDAQKFAPETFVALLDASLGL
jgi:hypothetical protein